MQNKFNKTQVARSFSRAATSYDRASFLQREVGDRLCNWLPKLLDAVTMLDLGSGTGTMTAKLVDFFPQAQIVGIDIADSMVKKAQHCFSVENRLNFLCADADCLPLANESVDAVFSNLMLQWSPDLDITLTEIYRVLKPQGHLIFSTLGSGSLSELRSSWEKIDGRAHLSSFITAEQLLLDLARVRLKRRKFEVGCHLRFFATIYDLMAELKMLGAHNLNEERHKGLSGKRKFHLLQEIYEQYRCNDKLPASYEVYYVYATK